MQFILKTLYAGPHGVFHVGQVLDAPEQIPLHEAEALIAGGYAAWLFKQPVAAAAQSPETAMVEPTAERAVRPAPTIKKPRAR
jgi:hypothetical protein